jgi:hypothetical protein
MGSYEPPPSCPGAAKTMSLPAGWSGHRVHSNRYLGDEFNFKKADDPFRGGRFDSHLGNYGYLYMASDMGAAVDETLVRDLPFTPKGVRALPKIAARSRECSQVVLRRGVELVDLRSNVALAALGQDYWLVDSESFYYPQTRVWAEAIRGWVPSADGFVWRPRHNKEALALVLFADAAAPANTVISRATFSLHEGDGAARLSTLLADRNILFETS